MMVYLKEMIRQFGSGIDHNYVLSNGSSRCVEISNFRHMFVLSYFKENSLLLLPGLFTNRISLKFADPKRNNQIEEQEPEHVFYKIEYIILLPNLLCEAEAFLSVTPLIYLCTLR